MYCTLSHSFSPKHVRTKEKGHRLGPCSFKSMGNFGFMQEVIFQNPTQPHDLPQGTRMQLVHVAHNCIYRHLTDIFLMGRIIPGAYVSLKTTPLYGF